MNDISVRGISCSKTRDRMPADRQPDPGNPGQNNPELNKPELNKPAQSSMALRGRKTGQPLGHNCQELKFLSFYACNRNKKTKLTDLMSPLR